MGDTSFAASRSSAEALVSPIPDLSQSGSDSPG